MMVQASIFPNSRVSWAWLLGFIAALLTVIVFREELIELVRRWHVQEEYSHGYLVPLVAAWLLWARRDVLVASIGSPTWTGPVLVAFAMLVHVVGKFSTIFILSQLAFVI